MVYQSIDIKLWSPQFLQIVWYVMVGKGIKGEFRLVHTTQFVEIRATKVLYQYFGSPFIGPIGARCSCKNIALNVYQHVERVMISPAVKRLWLLISNQTLIKSIIINVNKT